MTKNNSTKHSRSNRRFALLSSVILRTTAGLPGWLALEPITTLLCDCGSGDDRGDRYAEFLDYLWVLRVFARELRALRREEIRASGEWVSLLRALCEAACVAFRLFRLRLIGWRYAVLEHNETNAVKRVFDQLRTLRECDAHQLR